MPTPADFEEKTYEQMLNFALAGHGGRPACLQCGSNACANGHISRGPIAQVWSPGQVLEGVIGVDAVVAVNALAAPGYAWRDDLGGRAAETARSAPQMASLFLQYNRREIVKSRLGHGRCLDKPYLRFKVSDSQHRKMTELSARAAGAARIGYVSPAFHTSFALQDAARRGALLEESVFLSVDGPVRGPGPRNTHDYGAYDGFQAAFFSEPEGVKRTSVAGLLKGIQGGSSSSIDGLVAHIGELAERLGIGNVERYENRLDRASLQIANAAAEADLVWLVVTAAQRVDESYAQ